MCGEHFIISARGLGKTGSSPHVRGALSQLQCPCRWLGIIPACAGSTRTLRGFRTGRWDHPRMCGEHYVHRPQLDWDVGSSPHVRGARQACDDALQESGIIPACAGSTTVGKTKLLFIWDHPRMCGEHADGNKTIQGAKGSSPHVRGARHAIFVEFELDGIIPACAGSTPRHGSSPACRRDHPRMCGEHTKELAIGECTVGSSPHVRGARLTLSTQPPATGIIPACAGSTPLLARIRPIQQGSSPHVRGAQKHCRHRRGVPGIIPACAGSTGLGG